MQSEGTVESVLIDQSTVSIHHGHRDESPMPFRLRLIDGVVLRNLSICIVHSGDSVCLPHALQRLITACGYTLIAYDNEWNLLSHCRHCQMCRIIEGTLPSIHSTAHQPSHKFSHRNRIKIHILLILPKWT